MRKHNPTNERIKRQYFKYLKEARRYSETTVDAVANALSRFEEYTGCRDFKAFRTEQAVGFKRRLAKQKGQRSGKVLSKATLYATLSHLKRFFQWLAGQPGYKSRLQYSGAEYFNLSDKETRVATARRSRPVPTLEQVKHAIGTMPSECEIQMRDRTVLAFTLLTGARDGAIVSLKLKHVDLSTNSVFQDAREVRTKYSKSFKTFFFPVGDDIQQIVVDWVKYLQEVKLWGNDDPLFPATHVARGADQVFAVAGLKRAHWSNASPIRRIFGNAFRGANLPYFNPHSLRSTLTRLGETICKTPEDFKAWSQNLGHERVLTTFSSYGEVPSWKQREIIRSLASTEDSIRPDDETIAKAIRLLRGK